jgi:hypothetical protein
VQKIDVIGDAYLAATNVIEEQVMRFSGCVIIIIITIIFILCILSVIIIVIMEVMHFCVFNVPFFTFERIWILLLRRMIAFNGTWPCHSKFYVKFHGKIST